MDGFKRALEYIRRMWGNLNASQRVLLAAASVGMVLLLVWGSTGVAGDSMHLVVGHEVSDAERGEILKNLQEKNIRYEIRNRDIYVPREDSERVVLELAGDGVMSDKAVWQWLANSDIVASKWQLEKRYQIALQRKLEMLIRKIDGVRGAGVVLSFVGEAQQLFKDSAKASATVQVELRPGAQFGRGQAKSVATLVARAVPGLETDRVVITDTKGNSYSIPRDNGNMAVSGEIRDLEARLEEDIKLKITDIFGSTARVVVRTVAKTTHMESEERTHTRPQVVDSEESKRVEKSKPAGGVPGIKGEGSLIPQEAGGVGKEETEQSLREKSAIDTKWQKTIDPSGAIQKVTVGVLIPVNEGEKEPMSEDDARRFVLAAAGSQADVAGVIVKYLPQKKAEKEAPTPMTQQILELLGAKWTTLAAIVFAVIGMIILLRIVRGATPKGTVEEIQTLAAQLGEGPEIEVPQPVLSNQDNINRVKQGIQDVISKNPASAAVGLKQWMGEQAK